MSIDPSRAVEGTKAKLCVHGSVDMDVDAAAGRPGEVDVELGACSNTPPGLP